MKFDLQPNLTGSLVSLRPLRRSDRAALFAVASDPLIWEQHPEPNRWQQPVFDKLFERLMDSGGALLVCDAQSGEAIGSSSYYAWNPEANDIVIGYTFLSRRVWGGRYNGELKQLMADHAFRFVDRVWFHVGTSNRRSQIAMQKVGARLSHEAVRESGGVLTSFLHYVIERDDWKASQ
ncbi:MAG: GNAT family N-acetyltransferase [Steroidobacteraceae bacterium]